MFRRYLTLVALPVCLLCLLATGYAQTDITNSGGTITAQYTDSPSGEDIAKLIDNNTNTKYLTFHASGWVQFQASAGAVVTSYTITSANDAAERDPKNFNLQGSNNGTSWTTLNTQSNQTFASRFLKKTYTFSNSTSYTYYRLNVTAVQSGTILQMAEWELLAGSTPPTGVVTVYKDINYAGASQGYAVGTYTTAQMVAKGTVNNDVSSVKVTAGYKVTFYDSDNFTGTAVTKTADDATLVDDSFNDKASSMRVEVATTTPDFTLSRSPSSLTFNQGSSGTSTITVNKLNGFNSSVSLSASGMGTGVTASFNPSSTTGTSTLTLTASSSAATGTRTVTVTGVSGSLTRTTTISLTVNTSGGGDWSGFVYPTVTFTDQAAGTSGSNIFKAAVPNVTSMMQGICLEICKQLYSNNSDPRVNFTKLNLILTNNPNDVAWKAGDPPEITIGIGYKHIENVYSQNGNSYAVVLKEVEGILAHEGTHGYQANPKNCGTYDGSSQFWAVIEGEADGVRAVLRNWSPTRYASKGGSWMNGYERCGFFFKWAKDTKKSTFLIDLNHTCRDMGTWSFDAAFNSILGMTTQTAWNQYQSSLGGTEALAVAAGTISGISKAYPNPLIAGTTISYGVKTPGHVKLAVYNALGQRVKTLVNGTVGTNPQTATWNRTDETGNTVGSGVYFARLEVGGTTHAAKLIVTQ